MKRMTVIIVLLVGHAFGQQPPTQWRFQRSIQPNARIPQAEQCVVLDADLFAKAAPGLRDVRLLQDGHELAFALDESHDETFDQHASALPPGAAPTGNRAQYETSLIIPAIQSKSPWQISKNPEAKDPVPSDGWFLSQGLLPAHVPVERVRLLPEASGQEALNLRVAQQTDQTAAETLEAIITRTRPAADFTIGANLQVAADVRAAVHGEMANVQAFVLEMRRREICYQPLSVAPLLLLFGNEHARPVRYEYAAHFQPSATPVLATLGPIETNPVFHEAVAQTVLTRGQRLLLAGCVAAAAFILTVVPLLRKH